MGREAKTRFEVEVFDPSYIIWHLSFNIFVRQFRILHHRLLFFTPAYRWLD
jgi:hypothetical protein